MVILIALASRIRRRRCSPSVSASAPSSASSPVSASRGNGRASVGRRQSTRHNVCGRSLLHWRSGACLSSRWGIVGVDKTPGCRIAAGPPSSRRPPTPPPLFRLKGPSVTGSLPFSCPFFLFVPPVSVFVTPAPLKPASNCLDASPCTGRDRLPEPSELAGAREGAGAGLMEVPESLRALGDQGAVDVA